MSIHDLLSVNKTCVRVQNFVSSEDTHQIWVNEWNHVKFIERIDFQTTINGDVDMDSVSILLGPISRVT